MSIEMKTPATAVVRRLENLQATPPHQVAVQPPNILRSVHQALRGRYIAAVVLGAVAGAACGLATWRLVHPIYTSESLVQLAYILPTLGGQPDMQTGPVPLFDAVLSSQKDLISSRAVIDVAVIDPIWKAMGCQVPNPPDRYF